MAAGFHGSARTTRRIRAELQAVKDSTRARAAGHGLNRILKDAPTKAFHPPHLGAPKAHVLAFVWAGTFAKHLKALRWRTPFQAVCDAWKADPSGCEINPHHLIPGPNS